MTTRPIQDRDGHSSLPDELRASTRQKHHALNTQIIARLSLCLPPHAASPLDYAKGMIVFGQIYFTFEESLSITPTSAESNDQVKAQYASIFLPQLPRSSRLRNDIEALKARLSQDDVADLGCLAREAKSLTRRISRALASKPHTVLAYAWVMYLALFNGGRWIRRQLVAAGHDFWRGHPLPLSFWEFEMDQASVDEEQLKNEFRAVFVKAATHLTAEERQDVVDETNRLFDLCSELVEYLDQNTAPGNCVTESRPEKSSSASLNAGTSALPETLRMCYTCARALFKTSDSTAQGSRLGSAS